MDGYRPRTHRPHLRVVTPGIVDAGFDDVVEPTAPDDLLSRLDPAVGGRDALWRLDANPIPDEPFDWSAVGLGDRALVADILELGEAACGVILDSEYCTIVRRALARIATNDVRVLRRGTNTARTAAALVWLAGQASGAFCRNRRRSGWLWAWFGVGSSVDRGRSLMRALGPVPDPGWHWERGDPEPLGDPALLHSSYRAFLIRQRDAFARIDERRRPVVPSADGSTARVRGEWVRPIVAAKGRAEGAARTLVTIGLGRDADDARYYAMSVPAAHDLIVMLERALADPAPDVP